MKFFVAARTKLNFQTAVLKARGQARGENVKYTQPENILSDVLTKAGTDIGEDSPFGKKFEICSNTYKYAIKIWIFSAKLQSCCFNVSLDTRESSLCLFLNFMEKADRKMIN